MSIDSSAANGANSYTEHCLSPLLSQLNEKTHITSPNRQYRPCREYKQIALGLGTVLLLWYIILDLVHM